MCTVAGEAESRAGRVAASDPAIRSRSPGQLLGPSLPGIRTQRVGSRESTYKVYMFVFVCEVYEISFTLYELDDSLNISCHFSPCKTTQINEKMLIYTFPERHDFHNFYSNTAAVAYVAKI